MAVPKLPSLVGVIHLPPLAGSPLSHGEHCSDLLHHAGLLAVKEAQMMVSAGFQSIILENFGDIPFFKNQVPPETTASMAVIAAAVREAVKVPLGINILRNDARSALAVAAVTGCDFIRVNVLSGVAASDQGMIEGNAAELLRERARLHAHVMIFADVHVKHAVTLSSKKIALAVEEAALRALADAVIVSGATTGRMIEISILEKASQIARAHEIPLFIGSGANLENISEIAPLVDGIIVSSALRQGGQAGAPLDANRVKSFAREFLKKPTKKKERVGKSKSKKK